MTQKHKVTKCYWKNSTDTLLNSDLQFVKEKKKAKSAKHHKRRHAPIWKPLRGLAGYRGAHPGDTCMLRKKGMRRLPLLPPAS